MSVYTIKELEKKVADVASINQMAVKDLIQALLDENLIRVEKIGSGNWYWSFRSDAKKTKEKVLNDLKAQEMGFLAQIADNEKEVGDIMARMKEDEEMLDNGGMSREVLMEAQETLVKEIEGLDKELGIYSDNDPTDVLKKVEETEKLKNSAIRWSENIESLETLIVNMSGNRTEVAILMQYVFQHFLPIPNRFPVFYSS